MSAAILEPYLSKKHTHTSPPKTKSWVRGWYKSEILDMSEGRLLKSRLEYSLPKPKTYYIWFVESYHYFDMKIRLAKFANKIS